MREELWQKLSAHIPDAVLVSLRRGCSPLRAWREYRGLSHYDMADLLCPEGATPPAPYEQCPTRRKWLDLTAQIAMDDEAVWEDVPHQRMRQYAAALDVIVELLYPDIYAYLYGITVEEM